MWLVRLANVLYEFLSLHKCFSCTACHFGDDISRPVTRSRLESDLARDSRVTRCRARGAYVVLAEHVRTLLEQALTHDTQQSHKVAHCFQHHPPKRNRMRDVLRCSTTHGNANGLEEGSEVCQARNQQRGRLLGGWTRARGLRCCILGCSITIFRVRFFGMCVLGLVLRGSCARRPGRRGRNQGHNHVSKRHEGRVKLVKCFIRSAFVRMALQAAAAVSAHQRSKSLRAFGQAQDAQRMLNRGQCAWRPWPSFALLVLFLLRTSARR
mmetsp:Transcript_4902/g.12198  ORF Transcript_4902/g.12198 Transcript_4902/m.12198 type:complete len:267 (-) Transcript_4902:2852-3652(-)